VERLELWSDRSTQWNSEKTLCRRVPLFIGGPQQGLEPRTGWLWVR